MTFRPLPVLTFLSLVSLGVLVVLGTWQFEKYREKSEATGAFRESVEVELQPNRTTGQSLPVAYGLIGGRPGWRAFMPVTSDDETGGIFLAAWAVFLGSSPPSLNDMSFPSQSRDGRFVTPVGKGLFSSPNAPGDGVFYTLDPEAMATYAGVDGPVSEKIFEPRQIVVFPEGAGLDQPETARLIANPYFDASVDDLPPSRHLGYALTWWGIGGALIAVYFAFHHARGRLTFRAKTDS